ncbi:YjbF family lipoprotein [Muricoccus radiodurans]|uniref:YjbF family lipoprotein n=1 Tax=Muricoccus radiodurans TaxID=2231721 RepID=UPI003CED1EB1
MPRVLPLLLALLLPACESTTGEDLVLGAENLLRASVFLPPRLSDGRPAPLSAPDSDLPEAAETAPQGPAILLAYGSQRKVATLLQGTGEQRMWRSDDGTVVATDGARVVATAGLATSIAATRLDGPDPLNDPLSLLNQPAVARRVVDLMPSSRDPARMRFGLSLECRMRAVPIEGAILVEERCGGGARFTNRYWADPSNGAIFRSEQWVGITDRPMVIEVLSPPAS